VFCPNPVDWNVVGIWIGAIATFLGAAATVGTLIWAVNNGLRLRTDAQNERRIATVVSQPRCK
jgi:hypothetical protein